MVTLKDVDVLVAGRRLTADVVKKILTIYADQHFGEWRCAMVTFDVGGESERLLVFNETDAARPVVRSALPSA